MNFSHQFPLGKYGKIFWLFHKQTFVNSGELCYNGSIKNLAESGAWVWTVSQKASRRCTTSSGRKPPTGVPPTVREICASTGLKSTSTVHAHLKTLERLGYITREAGLNRSIRVEGETPAARCHFGQSHRACPFGGGGHRGYIPFPPKAGKELFALHVSGLSMRDAGILDGDYVVAERVSTADDGEIVVAMIDDEATVKRLYREKEGVRLQPANPDFQPIYSDHASVLGKVIAVVRYY